MIKEGSKDQQKSNLHTKALCIKFEGAVPNNKKEKLDDWRVLVKTNT